VTFAQLLVKRLETMGATQADLARWLTSRGIDTTRQAVSDWCDGTSRPLAWKWKTLFHLLGVCTAAERREWTDALTAKVDRSPIEAETVSRVDADSRPVTDEQGLDAVDSVDLTYDPPTLSDV